MLYFAYGSNMFTKRLRKRVPSGVCLGMASLSEHSLRFHKMSKDGSTKADAFFTGDVKDVVYGVVFNMSRIDKRDLDNAEGLHYGYEVKRVHVYSQTGVCYRVFMYYATDIDEHKKPYGWYKKYVLRGANSHNLPVAYINAIKAVRTQKVKTPDYTHPVNVFGVAIPRNSYVPKAKNTKRHTNIISNVFDRDSGYADIESLTDLYPV